MISSSDEHISPTVSALTCTACTSARINELRLKPRPVLNRIAKAVVSIQSRADLSSWNSCGRWERTESVAATRGKGCAIFDAEKVRSAGAASTSSLFAGSLGTRLGTGSSPRRSVESSATAYVPVQLSSILDRCARQEVQSLPPSAYLLRKILGVDAPRRDATQ